MDFSSLQDKSGQYSNVALARDILNSLTWCSVIENILRGIQFKPPSPSVMITSDALSTLTKPPCEPLAEGSLCYLSLTAAFVIAITSTRSVSKLNTLMANPPFMVFHKDNIVLRHDPRFLPKVISEFLINQIINLTVVFPRPFTNKRASVLHTSDSGRALPYY